MFSKTVSIARELIEMDPQFYKNVMLTADAERRKRIEPDCYIGNSLSTNAVADGFHSDVRRFHGTGDALKTVVHDVFQPLSSR